MSCHLKFGDHLPSVYNVPHFIIDLGNVFMYASCVLYEFFLMCMIQSYQSIYHVIHASCILSFAFVNVFVMPELLYTFRTIFCHSQHTVWLLIAFFFLLLSSSFF